MDVHVPATIDAGIIFLSYFFGGGAIVSASYMITLSEVSVVQSCLQLPCMSGIVDRERTAKRGAGFSFPISMSRAPSSIMTWWSLKWRVDAAPIDSFDVRRWVPCLKSNGSSAEISAEILCSSWMIDRELWINCEPNCSFCPYNTAIIRGRDQRITGKWTSYYEVFALWYGQSEYSSILKTQVGI